MKHQVYRDFNAGKWIGGETTQLAIYPKEAKVQEKDFLWRLSTSEVIIDNSTFADFTGYERVLMILDGEIILSHGDDVAVRLGKYAQDRFDGGKKTVSFGKVKDYNLIIKKGIAGALDIINLTDKKIIPVKPFEGFKKGALTLYCINGYGIVTFNGEKQEIKEGEQFVLEFDVGEIEEALLVGKGDFVVSEIFLSEELLVKEEEIEEVLYISDFVFAMKIANTQYRRRWKSSYKKQREWYSPLLRKRINKIRDTYVTLVIGFIGLALASFLSLELLGPKSVFGAIIIWLAVDILLINPLIYYLAIPKPVADHIRSSRCISKAERDKYKKEEEEQSPASKILKKYKITSRNVYMDEDEE